MISCVACGTAWGGSCSKNDRVRVALPDGSAGTAVITAHQPDTFFSIPAKLKWRGVTLEGYVGSEDGGHYFRPVLYGKNLEGDRLAVVREWHDATPVTCWKCKAQKNILDMNREGVLYECLRQCGV